MKNRAVLLEAVRAAVGGILPGPFAYAARWDEQANTYVGLVTEQVAATGAPTVHDDGVIVRADVAIAHRPPPTEPEPGAAEPDGGNGKGGLTEPDVIPAPVREKRPTRFVGTVMISQQRPVDELLQVVEEVVEHLTTLPDCKVELKLEIDAEVPSGLDPARARTITENATTLDFIDNKLSSPDER